MTPRSTGVDLALQSGQVMVAHAEEFFREPADAARLREMARLSASAGVAVVPNLFAFRDFIEAALNLSGALEGPEIQYASPTVYVDKLPANRRGDTTTPEETVVSLREDIARFGRLTTLLDDAGALILTGTDTEIFGFAGTSLHHELEELVAAGLPAERALWAATRNAGEFLARHVPGRRKLGEIEVGSRADIVLLDGNPLESIAALRDPEGVMVGGRWLPAEELRRMRDSAAGAMEEAKRELLLFDGLVTAGRAREAVQALSDFRVRHPDLLPAMEVTLREYGRRLAQADKTAWVEVARETVQVHPLSPSAREELATALHAAGDPAVEHVREAVAMSPHDAFLRNRLARLEAALRPRRSEPAGVYELRITDVQATAYPPPTTRSAMLRLSPLAGGFGGKLERAGKPEASVGTVVAGEDRIWIDIAPSDERPIELRLTLQGDAVSGLWVQGVGRRWALTGRRIQ
jgi:hypothetical protein